MPAPRTPAAEPDFLLPRWNRGADFFSDRNLDVLSHLLDDFLRIPGTRIRIGLEGIIGFIPIVGDVLGAMASWIIILAAWLRGVPKVTIIRMMVNVALETIIGTVPILGDAFDIAFKANRRNFRLLERSVGAIPHYGAAALPGGGEPLRLPPTAAERRRHRISDWIFLLWLVVLMMAILATPVLLLAWLVGHFFAMGVHSAH